MTSVSPASSSFAFPRPHSPPKPATTLSNAHPYPIKTTSTALLSRSNSTSSSAAPPRHHYVPPSPSQSPSPRREREAYRGHRYSRSLSSSDDLHLPGGAGGVQGPRALPIPPKSAGANGDVNGNQNNGDISPKRWTSVQLAAHLGTTVSREAGEWAAQRGIGGRAFMRLTEEDLVAMGAPPALHPAAHALRQGVLKGQLDAASEDPFAFGGGSPTRMGSGSPTRMISGSPTRMGSSSPTRLSPTRMGRDDGTPQSKAQPSTSPFASRSPFISKTPFSSTYHPPESPTERASPPPQDRFRNGRVQGMVRSFENSGSESEGEGSGFRRRGAGNGSASGSEDGSAVGATVRPGGRALPRRPDTFDEEEEVDLGATVRADDTGATVRGHQGQPAYIPAQGEGGQEEMTVEELLALESVPTPAPAQRGSWRRSKGRRSRNEVGGAREEREREDEGEVDGQGQDKPHGRPLPAQPHAHGGVHAWEAEEGMVGRTVKWVPAGAPAVGAVFTDAEGGQDDGKAEKEQRAMEQAAKAVAKAEEAKAKAEEAKAKAEEAKAKAEKARAKAEEARAKAEEAREQEAAARAREQEERAVALEKEKEKETARQQETDLLRAMVDTFRRRLEDVERRVGEMEARLPSPSTAPATASSAPSTSAGQSALATLAAFDPRRLLALFAPSEGAREGREEWVGPTTIGALPSYVLLVGLGVCAVVLRVLVRRGLGAVRRR